MYVTHTVRRLLPTDYNRIALKNDQIYIVQASILGSILVNLLLVLGSALLASSVTDVDFVCNTAEAQLLACLLFVSVFVVLMPVSVSPRYVRTSNVDRRLSHKPLTIQAATRQRPSR